MKIRALKAFTVRNSETGDLTSIANGEIAEVSDTLGQSLISDGLAEEYTLISPTGSIEITSNGTVDVAEYASAVVNVPGITPTGSIEITSNGTVDVTNYASAVVNVDGPDYATINFNLPASPPTKTTPRALSVGRERLAATTVGNYALFGGGSPELNTHSDLDTVDVYDLALVRTTATVLSEPRRDLAATTVGNYALFGGGYYYYDVTGNGASRRTVDAYDQTATKVTSPAPLSQARDYLAATTVGDYALFGGGDSSGNSSDVVDAYDTNLQKSTNPAVLSVPRRDLAATTVGNYALFGGGSSSDVVDAYDTNLQKSTNPAVLSAPRYGLAATTVGDYALFGGGNSSDVVDAYDTNLQKSITPAVLSEPRSNLAATTVGNHALFGGGFFSSATVDAYSVEKHDVQLFPGTKYSFNGTAESTSSTWQTISVVGNLTGYMKVKNVQIN